jgi:hypothetical protein
MLIQEEIWKDVKNFEGYYKISNKGRVKSLARTILKRNGVQARISEKFLEPTLHPDGQAVITMSKDSKVHNTGYKSLLRKHFGKKFEIVNVAPTHQDQADEVFVPVKGYEGSYEISNKGTIKSVRRFVKRKDSKRRVVGRVMSHNYTHLCLSKDEGKPLTNSFPKLLLSSFYPTYDTTVCEPPVITGDKGCIENYQYFRKLEHNPITVTTPNGDVHKFSNYISCAQTYQLKTPNSLAFKQFFFKGVHTVNPVKGLNLDGYQFTFDHPVHYNGEIRITKVYVKAPSKRRYVPKTKRKNKQEVAQLTNLYSGLITSTKAGRVCMRKGDQVRFTKIPRTAALLHLDGWSYSNNK